VKDERDDPGGNTALMKSAGLGHTEIVKLLIKANADVNSKDKDGQTALSLAVDNDHTEIIQLLENLVTPTEDLFHAAAKKGNAAGVQRWLDAKGDVNAKDEEGGTALGVAAIVGHTEIVELLLKANADVNMDVMGGNTALMFACGYGHTEIVERLLNAEADVNAKVVGGGTALMIAAGNGNMEILQLLIKGKADIKAQTNHGETALMKATENDHTEVIKFLQGGYKVIIYEQLSTFLQTISLQKYFDALVACDYETVTDLKKASKNDLKECGIPPKSRKIIKKALAKYKTEL